MIKFSITVCILALLSCGPAQGDDSSQCGVCQAGNNALCVTETTYYNCWDGEKFGREMQCPQDYVCSNTNSICEPKASIAGDIKNVCNAADDKCGKCEPDKKYTCVSPTQVGRCVAGEVAAVINCKADEICVASAEPMSVCVPKCAADFFKYKPTCSADSVYTTTTVEPPTTPTSTERLKFCEDAADDHKTVFFYTYADTTCKNAIYCQRSTLTSTDWRAIYRACPSSAPYFDMTIRDCVKAKPASCSTISTTTTTSSESTTTTSTTTPTVTGPTDSPPASSETADTPVTPDTPSETTESSTDSTTEPTTEPPLTPDTSSETPESTDSTTVPTTTVVNDGNQVP